MLQAAARITHRHPWRVLLAVAVILLIALPVGGRVAETLDASAGGGSFEDPTSEHVHAIEALERATGVDPEPGVIALVRPPGGVGSAQGRDRLADVAGDIRDDPAVGRVVSALDEPALAADDRRSALVVAHLRAVGDDATGDAAERIQDRLAGARDVTLGGPVITNLQVSEQIREDLARAEMLAFPLLFVLALWVFRSLVAALLPIAVGAITILVTFLALRAVNEAVSLSVFAINLVTGLGLGLAIDYSLFIVSRYREELVRARSPAAALERTLATAGRTVLFSALTVGAALASLIVFRLPFLYSMGIGGALVAVIAAATALLPLPAMLALLGPRVNALAPERWKRTAERNAAVRTDGGWYRLSTWVLRRRGRVAIVTAAILLLAGVPALRTQFTGVDASALPTERTARVVEDAIASDFGFAQAAPVHVAIEAPRAEAGDVRDYAERVERVTGPGTVSAPRFVGANTWQLDVATGAPPLAQRSQQVLDDVRAVPAPHPVMAGGQTAHFVDQQASLGGRLPIALAVLVVTTLVLLFTLTGSVIVPIKALLMNLLTISAALGLLVLIFQDGRLETLLGYTSVGALEATQPILLCALAFGLSTDYGVFLITRIKEARDAGASDDEAVSLGLERTGRIVSAAALLFCVAIGAFATSEIAFIKEVGVGTALAVIIDATIVRCLLVPALMGLLGARNWWAPRGLRRLHRHLRVAEHG